MKYTCKAFPNDKRSDYTRHTAHPIASRRDVAERLADSTLAYYHNTHVGGDGRFPTNTDLERLERLADYILAEDHAAGLSILRDPHEPHEAIPVDFLPGEGAIAYMQKYGVTLICPADAEPLADGKNTKICPICRYVFEDPTRNKNKKYCGDSCVNISENLALRLKRNGTTELEGERRRMRLEYGFYNPQEMKSLETRSEQAKGDYEDISRMDAAKKRKARNGRKTTVRLIDKRGTKENAYLDGQYGWKSDRNEGRRVKSPIWWGPLVTYNVREQPLTEPFKDAKVSSRHLRLIWEGNGRSHPI